MKHLRIGSTSLALLVLALGLSMFTVAQAPAAPVTDTAYVPIFTFDVASIRLSPKETSFRMGMYSSAHSSSFSGSHTPVKMLIQNAYGLSDLQISGLPDSFGYYTQFNIEAKSGSSVDEALAKLNDQQAKLEKQHMLQTLLADRFKLKTHMETKILPVSSLVIAKSGTKLRESEIDGSNPEAKKEPPFYERTTPQGEELVGQGVPMGLLASFLSSHTSTTVLDKTGLTGKYDFTLQFQRGSGDDASKWPPITEAIQEQLGLKLEMGKGPVQILVIDHIEMPSEN